MFKTIYPVKDATLYQIDPNKNTGLDEILEVSKRIATNGTSSFFARSTIQFDMNEIISALQTYGVNLNQCRFNLQLYTSDAKFLPAEYTIDARIVGDNWINGTGFEYSSPKVTNGVSWLYTNSSNSWTSGSVQVGTTSLYITGTGQGGSWLYQSGSASFNSSYFNQSFFTQPGLDLNEDFSYRVTDLNIDVTDAIKLWISGSDNQTIPNNGFLLSFSEADEQNQSMQGVIRFFSRETHTIYVPRLVMYFDNSEYSSSLDDIDLDDFIIYVKMKSEYKDTEVAKIQIRARDRYPMKSATNLFPLQTVKKLPQTAYYSIVDARTNETIIPFDDIYTKISCNSNGNFIYLDMDSFMPERYYRLRFKIVNGFETKIYEHDTYFKVTR
jgi:hypothetical protein